MPAKTLISIRVSALTAQQITDLRKQTGMNQTEVISVAIDRMAREESKMEFYILVRERENDIDWDIVSVVPGADPLYGRGLWNVHSGPFGSWIEANHELGTIAEGTPF